MMTEIQSTLEKIYERLGCLESMNESLLSLKARVDSIEKQNALRAAESKKRKNASGKKTPSKKKKVVNPVARGTLIIQKFSDKCLLTTTLWMNEHVKSILKEHKSHWSSTYRGWLVSLETIDEIQKLLDPWFQKVSVQIKATELIVRSIPKKEDSNSSLLFLTDSDMEEQ